MLMSGTKATPLQRLTGIAGYCANTMALSTAPVPVG
jgi:hypothetical protein